MRSKGRLVLHSRRLVFRRINAVTHSNSLKPQGRIHEDLLRCLILKGHIANVYRVLKKREEKIRKMSDHPLHCLLHERDIEEGKLCKESSEAEIDQGVPNGSLEKIFGLVKLGQRREAYAFFELDSIEIASADAATKGFDATATVLFFTAS